MAAPVVSRGLSTTTSHQLDLSVSGTQSPAAGGLGVLLVQSNNGLSTGAPTAPAGWSTAFVASTLDGVTPTGTFAAQFYKVLDGNETTVTVGGTAIQGGTRRLHYQELVSDVMDGVWELHAVNPVNGDRSLNTASIDLGSLAISEEALAYGNVMWDASLPSGTPAPTWTPDGWPLEYYERYHGSMVERPITVDGTYGTVMELASSLTRSMCGGLAAYACVAPPPAVDTHIPIGIVGADAGKTITWLDIRLTQADGTLL